MTTINKRQFLATGLAAAGALTLPRRAWTQTILTGDGIELSTLSDGNLMLPADFIFGPMPQDELSEVIAGFGINPDEGLQPPCNLTLLRQGENVILFDAGSGSSFQPSAGQIWDALDAASLDPGDVTHVIFTHGHPDHLWGVLDDFDEPMFYNAEHMMGAAEFAYWTDAGTVNTIDEAWQSFAVGALRRLETIGGDMTLFEDGDEVAPGVTAQMTPGHTPGHMSFVVDGLDRPTLILGDAIGNHHVAFARPEWPSGSDQDAQTALATRAALFDQITADAMRIVGFHLPGGGIGQVGTTADGGYAYIASA